MSYTLSRPSPFQRSGLLTAVISLHAGIFLILLAAKTVAPQIIELPLIVDLLETLDPSKDPIAMPSLRSHLLVALLRVTRRKRIYSS